MRLKTLFALLLAASLLPACSSPTEPSSRADFIVSVEGEQFVLRLTDPETIQLAEENLQGRNQKFPNGPLRQGNGGFNAPWTWHLDPAQTRMVDVAIEVCDGRPSYVEAHESEFPRYCPWGAQITGRK